MAVCRKSAAPGGFFYFLLVNTGYSPKSGSRLCGASHLNLQVWSDALWDSVQETSRDVVKAPALLHV